MTQPVLHSTPRPREVLAEQVRAVGLALRGPALAVAALLTVWTLLLSIEILRDRAVINFRPEFWIVSGLVGLLLPIGVWKGEDRFGAAFFWTLPVDRRRHALAKIFAGWVWLMVIVAVFVLWMLGISLLSGGRILGEEMLRLLPAGYDPEMGGLDPGALQTVQWRSTPLLWIVPFTGATATYLIASALALGTRHPLRWIVGAVLTLFLVSFVGLSGGSQWLALAPSRMLESLLHGTHGLQTLLTGRIQVDATLSTGEVVAVWRALPDMGQWAAATLLWTGAGLVALWAAASRHRERRRA